MNRAPGLELPADAVVMNPASGLEICCGDEDYRRYLDIFVQSYQPVLAELHWTPASPQRLREIAHPLKSVASYLALERVAALALNAQVALDGGLAEAEPIRAALHAELALALSAIEAFLAQPPELPEPPGAPLSFDQDQVRQALRFCSQAIRSADIDGLELGLAALAASLPDAHLRRLRDRVAYLDFGGAERAILQLARELGLARPG